MSTRAQLGRMGIHIPQFSSTDQISRPRGQSATAMRSGHRPVLRIRMLNDRQFGFALRSKLNATIASGGPLPLTDDLDFHARALIARCQMDDALRLEQDAVGHFVSIVDPDGKPLGRTRCLPDANLARAMQRLIAIQAMQARIELG